MAEPSKVALRNSRSRYQLRLQLRLLSAAAAAAVTLILLRRLARAGHGPGRGRFRPGCCCWGENGGAALGCRRLETLGGKPPGEIEVDLIIVKVLEMFVIKFLLELVIVLKGFLFSICVFIN